MLHYGLSFVKGKCIVPVFGPGIVKNIILRDEIGIDCLSLSLHDLLMIVDVEYLIGFDSF